MGLQQARLLGLHLRRTGRGLAWLLTRGSGSGSNVGRPLPMNEPHHLSATTLHAHVTRRPEWRATCSAAMLILLHAWAAHAEGEVNLVRVPEGGIQPQIVSDENGTLHLLYFKGEASAGDLFYARQAPGDSGFGKPIRVNGRPGSAMAVGTIRGGQLAVGEHGRIHVAWNGPVPKGGDHTQAPMLYTRLNDDGSAFEPERDVITKARGLDGGGSVAADGRGNVYVTWHAPKPGNTQGEAGRAVFVAHSRDGGRSFAPERLAIEQATGACGCCGMKAFADGRGNLFISYRGASETGYRDQLLLVARDGRLDFQVALTQPWKVAACPMSSTSFSQTVDSVLAAWETADQVCWSRFRPGAQQPTPPSSPPTVGRNPKHPVAVGNSRGEVLLVWTEGTGWAKGGDVAWQRFDAAGKPVRGKEHVSGLPTWSMAAAVTTRDGRFVVVY